MLQASEATATWNMGVTTSLAVADVAECCVVTDTMEDVAAAIDVGIAVTVLADAMGAHQGIKGKENLNKPRGRVTDDDDSSITV